ncbi:sensor histidine kinase [Paenibacillus sepulcri]|uniref:Sensor histidine kinase n=1 Tax=Paenibacillus sepulcri TaxID=359917 RepID=A0ABS7C1Y4_9BACL|nr:sensor histidine kinase [Paenibacillus sepulcri]
MNIWNRMTSLSIYPKLVLTFLVILSPMYLISWRMNDAGSGTVEKEITQSLLSRTSLYVNMLEFDLSRVISLLQEYVNDEDLLKLSSSAEVMSEIEKMQAQLGLKKRLDILKRSSKFVENASAFIPSMNRTVSANDNIFTSFNEDQFQSLAKSTNRFESPFLVWQDRIFISLPYPDPAVSSDQKPVFLLTVEISRKELADVLKEFTNEGGGAILAGEGMSWTVSGTRNEADAGMLEEAGMSHAASAAHEAEIREVTLKDDPYMVVSKSSTRLGMTLFMYIPSKSVTASLDSYRSWFSALSIASIFIVLLFSYSIYLIIHQPLKKLVRSFRRIEQGHFNLEMNYPLKDEFGYLYGQFNGMVKRLDVLVHEVYEQQYRARTAELRHLQSQINPHFLYNSYFILYRMAMLKDHDNVIYFTKHLGEYFEFITRDGADEVPLENEIKHARTYAEIQSVRFGSRIQVEFDELPEEAGAAAVPRLILQPLIENCYNHGLEHKRKGGWIRVRIICLPDKIVIIVEDNGGTIDEEKLRELQSKLHQDDQAHEHTGLLNVHRRIQIRYGGLGGLTLETGEEKGLKVTMTLPREGEMPG